MININANLIKDPVTTSFLKDGKEVEAVNFTLAKRYGKDKNRFKSFPFPSSL